MLAAKPTLDEVASADYDLEQAEFPVPVLESTAVGNHEFAQLTGTRHLYGYGYGEWSG